MTKQRNILSRSVYRKTRCSDRMYFTVVDGVHVAAWYDPDMDGMEVVRVKQETPVLEPGGV